MAALISWPHRVAILVAALLLPGLSIAEPEDVPLVVIDDSRQQQEVWPHLQVALQPGKAQQHDLPSAGADWQPLPSQHRHLGVGEAPAWARFRLRYVAEAHGGSRDWYLVHQQSFVDDVRLYRRDASGAWQEVPGLRQTSRGFLQGARNPAFLLRLVPGATVDLLVRTQTRSHRRFPLVLIEADAYRRSEWRNHLLLGAVSMTALLSAAFLLMLWRVQRQRQIALMVAFILCELVGALWVGGLLQVVVPAATPRALGLIGTLSWACTLSLAYAHARAFLKLPERMPRANRALALVPWVAATGFLLEMLDVGVSRIVLINLAGITTAALLVVSLHQARRKVPYAGVYSLAWSTYVLSNMLLWVNLQGWIPPNVSNLTLFAQGSIVSMIFAVAVMLQLRDHEQQQQSALFAAEKRADQARFIVAMNHDLLQPLQAIGLLTELLADSSMDRQQRRWLAQLRQARTGLNDIIDSVLTVSRLDSADIDVRPERVALQPLFVDLVEEYAVVAEHRGLHLRWHSTRTVVMTDRRLLERILRNLVANALRYSARGAVLIGVRRRGRNTVGIQVVDQGPGIPVAQRERMFLPYQRGENRPRDDRGYGLGLAVVRGLTEALQSPLVVRSVEGRGSCFELRLPLAGGTPDPHQ